jgi:hypothetical protein
LLPFASQQRVVQIHHATTIFLMAFSYTSLAVHHGSLVLLLHDFSDVWSVPYISFARGKLSLLLPTKRGQASTRGVNRFICKRVVPQACQIDASKRFPFCV